jgi:hypothetical protein
VSLERGPLSLVSTTEELLDRKVAALVWIAERYLDGYLWSPSMRFAEWTGLIGIFSADSLPSAYFSLPLKFAFLLFSRITSSP